MKPELIMLGTGHAMVTKCYNTCFSIRNGEEYFLVDAGGGNGILLRLDEAQIPFEQIRSMFLTHAHTDHILGAVWIVRKAASMMLSEAYHGHFTIYCHEEAAKILKEICRLTLAEKFLKFLGGKIRIQEVEDGEEMDISGMHVRFFDIHSTKAKQFGFRADLDEGISLACIGDEPYNRICRPYVEGVDWMLCEAFCLYGMRDIFHPYEKHHSTALDAGNLAEKLKVRNLVLYHTEDTDLKNRKKQYTREVKLLYSGTVYVPDDLEVLKL